jgi:hypothetical protein
VSVPTPSSGTAAAGRLPVHSSADVHLADAFGLAGCPLCRERARTEAAYLEAILAESVNDVAFRQGLDAARGLCAAHARAVLDADRRRSGSLGAAILLRATLAIRLRELEAAASDRGRSRTKRVEAAARPPACPVCGRVARADASMIDTVGRQVDEAPWAAAVGAAPFCLEHLLALMSSGPRSAAWPSIEAQQLDRLRRLRDDLEAYAHRSSHDRRHLMTDAHRASVDEAADVLGGSTGTTGAGVPPRS